MTVRINNLQGNTVQFEEEKNDDDIINMYTIAARQTLDDKQMAAYSIICCSFMMRYLIDTSSQSDEKRACRAILKMIANKISDTATKDDIKEMLKERGAQEQLVMFLSGPAGSGKSHVISSCQQCCKMFCDHAELPFDSDIFRITACTGSAAASLESGTTIHSAAEINKNEKNITYNSEEWEYTNILLIDEISFFGYNSLVKLDKNLRLLTGDRGQIYGGRNLIFVGDFKQLRTFEKIAIYERDSILWQGSINTAVFLEQSHRFKDDPEWGKILERISTGTATENDIKKINSRVIDDKKVKIPTEGNICYACPTNKGRNSIATYMFRDHVISTHPKFDNPDEEPPNHTIIIESVIYKNNRRRTGAFHQTIYNNVGDASVQTSHKKLIDPALKLYHDLPVMSNSNKDVKNGIANGTLARFKGIKLKNNDKSKVFFKNWDGYKVRTVSAADVEYILCEHWEGKKDVHGNILPPKKFKVYLEKSSADMTINMHGINVTTPIKIDQFGLLNNISTTGHKL